MPPLPDDVSSVSSRYTRLAELCRESAAKARLATIARSLRKRAAGYERIAREAEAKGRPMFRFADLKRKAGLGAHKAEHGSD